MLSWLVRQDHWSRAQVASATTVIVCFSIFSYTIIAIKYAMTRSYLWLYNNLLKKWIHPFATALTQLIGEKNDSLQQEIKNTLKQDAKQSKDIEEKAFAWLNAKIYALPTPIAKILVFFLKLTPIKDWILWLETNWMKSIQDKETLVLSLEQKIDNFMRNIGRKAFPFWTKLLLPINILLALFFTFH